MLESLSSHEQWQGFFYNGNLTKDSNKNISNIAYNVLNLPSKVTFSDGSTITYSYAADGTKLRTVHVHPNTGGKQEASDADRKTINSKNNAIYLKHNKTLCEYNKGKFYKLIAC